MFPVCHPLSQISLKSLLYSALFSFWHGLHTCPLFSASSLPPNVPLAPTLSAGIPRAAGLLVTIQLGLAFLAPVKIYWPSPAQPNMPRAWLCHRPRKTKAAAHWGTPTLTMRAEEDLVAKGSCSESMSRDACRNERRFLGLLHIPLLPLPQQQL